MIAGLLGAKRVSKRLPRKGWRDFNGKPMFQWNVEKGVRLFQEMYVSSDYDYILNKSKDLGAIPIKRTDPKLMDCPNIDYYLHALKFMDNPEAIVAIQVNSPTVDIKLIRIVKKLIKKYDEVKTCHPDGTDYGSIWAIRIPKLLNYPDPYNAQPDVWLVDESIDIHTEADLREAKKCQ